MKNLYLKLLVALLLAFSAEYSAAQSITDYSFTTTNETYTALSGGNTRSLTAGTASSGYFNGIPIGFTFRYMGTNYTTISASTEGWFTFGANLSASSSTNNLRTGTPRPIIAPLWDDLDLQNASNMSYKTTGSAGSQVFTIEYKNVQWSASAYGTTISFQVKLYETTGVVEFVYKSESGNVGSASASIGIAGPSSNSYLSVYELTFWGFPIGTYASSSNETNDINSKPGNGTTYTFTPPLPCTTPTVTATSTRTCVGANGGSVTASATGGTAPYTYSIDGDTYQSSATFTGLSAGNYTVYAKSSAGCVGSTTITVSNATASSDNQTTAGNDTWIGHVYDGTSFNTYMGQTTETETFDENFGANTSCFDLTSGSGTSSIYTETFSVKFRMNSTKNGLYTVSLGSDDGVRLTVDGTTVYSNWNDHAFTTSANVLLNLNGASSLLYEYYENGADNRVTFLNLNRILANNLTNNTTQTICVGNSGSSISGDTYGTLPTGITRSGTGYQWAYSTTPGGTRINIAGATGATFTPNTSTAPFNTTGTYYVYRNAVVVGINNIAPNPYTATNESNAATVNIVTIGTWTGNTSTSWNTASNWACNTVPTANTNVTIPATTRQPVITALTMAYTKNLVIQSGASITNNSVLEITGSVNNSGSISSENGTMVFGGTTAQVIPANLFADTTVDDLVISNAAGVSLAGPLKVIDDLAFGNVNNSTFNTNGHLTLVSTASHTANIADITNNSNNSGNKIVGEVTVERYVTSRRSYRFLTAPVNSSGSIKANWMENVSNESTGVNHNPKPGYGTHITGKGGSANGFDATVTNNASMFTFDNVKQAWLGVTSGNDQFKAGIPYRIMIRGSRSTNLNSNEPPPSFTTLRAKGSVITGTVVLKKEGATGSTAGMPVLSSTNNGYSLVANPYPSVVDWKQMVRQDISRTIYYYDPTISGSNGRGAYITYNDLLGIVSNLTSKVDNNIQSGQAFFVQTTGPNPSLTFKEQFKTTSRKSIFRPATTLPNITVKLLLPRQEDTRDAADGFAAYFSDDFDSTIADDDSYKMTNLDENIAILRNGKTLSIEGRKPVTEADTIPIKLWQLTQSRYSLKIAVANFSENVTTYLEDAYLKSKTVLNNDTETNISFNLESDPASIASDRFRIVFESFVTLPVQLTGIKASEKNKGVLVEWIAESESNIEGYEVERSNDAQNFTTAGTVKAKGNAGVAVNYSWFDANPFSGDNYYRIKSLDKSGEVKYSEVVRVNIGGEINSNSITATGVSSGSIQVAFKNAQKGNYTIQVINNGGQTMYTGTIAHTGGSASKIISTTSIMSVGTYNVLITNGTEKYNLQVWIK